MMEKNGSLLIVEDDDELRQVLYNYMVDICDNIELAENGLKAIDLIQQKKISAILSDIKMPKMDGIRLLEWLRKNNLNTPFVILTGFGDRNLALQALQLGAFQFLDKPPEESDLKEVVGKAIELGEHLIKYKGEILLENTVNKMIQENSDRMAISLAKNLGMSKEYIDDLKEKLILRYKN